MYIFFYGMIQHSLHVIIQFILSKWRRQKDAWEMVMACLNLHQDLIRKVRKLQGQGEEDDMKMTGAWQGSQQSRPEARGQRNGGPPTGPLPCFPCYQFCFIILLPWNVLILLFSFSSFFLPSFFFFHLCSHLVFSLLSQGPPGSPSDMGLTLHSGWFCRNWMYTIPT